MINYVEYVLATGVIQFSGYAGAMNQVGNPRSGMAIVQVADATITGPTHFIISGVAIARSDMSITASAMTLVADGTSTIHLASLPDPVALSVSGPNAMSATVTGGSLDLSFDAAGTYTLKFTAPLYLDKELVIHAT